MGLGRWQLSGGRILTYVEPNEWQENSLLVEFFGGRIHLVCVVFGHEFFDGQLLNDLFHRGFLHFFGFSKRIKD